MSGPTKEKPGATLAGATGPENYGAQYNFLRLIQHPFFAVGWWIEQRCARIEDRHQNERDEHD
jgi:hypothetical protein